jgi:hypothetical protein
MNFHFVCRNITRHVFLVPAQALIALSMVLGLMQFSTGGRMAYTMDSLYYRDAALNFVGGHPMQSTNVTAQRPERQPLLGWPPAYPALWASAAMMSGTNIDDTPSLLGPALLVANTLAMFWVCWMVTRKAAVACIVSVVNASAPTSLIVFGHAWSETLFIPLILLTYGAAWKYRLSRDKFIWLIVAAVSLGAANWVRYAGVVFLPLLGFSVLLASGATLHKRIFHATGAMLLGVALVFPLWLRNWQVAGNISGATRGGAARADRWLSDAATIVDLFEHSFFAFSMVLRAHLEIPILIVVVTLSFRYLRRHGIQAFPPLETWLPCAWLTGYLLFLLYARKVQSGIDLDLRLLAPAFPFLLLAITPAVSAAFSNGLLDIRKILVTLLLGLLVNSGLYEAVRAHESYESNGVPRWRSNFGLAYRDLRDTSPTSRAIRASIGNTDPSTLILTDYRAMYIRYLTGARVYAPPDGDCGHWTSDATNELLFIGAPELPSWATDCLKVDSHWRLLRPIGRAVPSMSAD